MTVTSFFAVLFSVAFAPDRLPFWEPESACRAGFQTACPGRFFCVPLLLLSHESAAIDHAQLTQSKTLADNVFHDESEPLAIVMVPLVESENLLFDVALQMERRAVGVRALDRSLEQSPKVLDAVDVNTSRN